MRTRLVALGVGLLLGVAACALVADLGDRTLAVEVTADGGDASLVGTNNGGRDSGRDSGGSIADGGDGGPVITGFSYSRTVTVTSDAPAALTSHAVLVILPSTFDYAHAKPNGEDVRFSIAPNHVDDLDYFIESWTPGAESHLWVKVPSVPVGASSLHMFYGKTSATELSSFASTFPNARRTAGADAGSFTATGNIDVDWFELKSGDTLTLAPGVPLKITARRIIVAGIIDGDGRGDHGGIVPNGIGAGPGGGGASDAGEAAGGGGFGGAGGRGGADVVDAGGVGGPAHGDPANDDIAMGSGGAASDVDGGGGGAGGGAVSLLGWKTTVTGVVRVNGADVLGGFARNGGGGAGGGVFVATCLLDLTGATLTAIGGAGGQCAVALNDGGGGGGGGRIKLRRRPNGSFAPATTMNVAFGGGGTLDSGTTAPGENGALGTTHVDPASTFLKGAETTLGPELQTR